MNQRLGLALAVIAAASLWAAAPAGALLIDFGTVDGVNYRGDRAEVTAPNSLDTAADCPNDKRVSGGGFGSEFATGSRAFSLSPFDSSFDNNDALDDGWAGIVTVPNGSPQDIDILSICSEGKYKYLRSGKVELNEIGAKSGSVDCAEGTHVVSGGALLNGTVGDAYINSTYPTDSKDAGKTPDDGWKARVYSETADGLDFRAYAVCSKDQPSYKTNSADIPASSAGGVSADCPFSKHLLGMGAKAGGSAATGSPVNLEFYDAADTPFDDVPDDGVASQLLNTDMSAPKSVTVYAMCG